jgi:hypothetical protein
MNQKYAVEAAADAIEARLSAEDIASRSSVDRAALCFELAYIGLKAAHEANVSGRLIEARTKAGRPITIRFWDKGDAVPGFYVSHYRSEEWECVVQVEKHLADQSGDVEGYRLMEDLAALDTKGVDITTLSPSPRRLAKNEKSISP